MSFDLPQGWAWVRLRDLGTFTGGHTPSTSNRDLWGDEVLWVTSKDMKSKYINDTILKLTQLGAAELTMLKPNSIIMCTRSGILRRTFPVAIATQHLTINQDQRALTLYIPEMAEYIYDVLKAFESVILAHYKKAGTTVESIIWNRFTEIPIPMPPLPEQRRIIAKIEELFAIADSLGVAADGLENAAKRLDKKILDLAIRGKLVPQDPNDEPASELVKRIATSHKSPCKNQGKPIDPPFEIPDSWEWVRLKELGVFCGGHTPSTSNPKLWGGDILWVSSKDMKSKYIDDTQIKVTRLGAEELNVLKPGALLMWFFKEFSGMICRC
ncbi:MAG: restriction endonuclease subunit S [Kiritimatiellae bacterium]|nr:restriction endonuclease subunit S [Kiritimatiellia bacterium]